VTINGVAVANAGADQTVCASLPNVTLAGSVSGAASSGTWSTSGTGTFDNANSMTAVYTPSVEDIAAGTVTLTLTTNNPSGSCPAVSDNMVVTINGVAVANAGADQTVCASFPNVTLAGSVSGAASSGIWSTSGTGTFDNANSMTAVYTPSAEDIAAGTVTLTLTTNDPSGPCPAVSDNMTIIIDPLPTPLIR
jgi:type IV secretory pathway TrbL component